MSKKEIEVTVRFFSTLKATVGTDSVSLQVPEGTPLREILRIIEEKYFTSSSEKLLKDDSSLSPGIICLVDDADASLMGGLNQKIKEPTTITLISSLHGG